MPTQSNETPVFDEVHRYFPEWADRPVLAGRLLEAEHNSYLAGGYAEEFGYQVRQGRPPIFPPLLGDPERSGEWSAQVGGLHPGYPECPRPAERNAQIVAPRSPILEGQDAQRAGSSSMAIDDRTPPGKADDIHFVQVDRSGAERHPGLLHPFAVFWERLSIRMRDHRI